jgi:hypothetical protein
MRYLLPVLALVTAAAWPGGADAQWKWRDARGQVTVSDLPPPRDIPERDILQRPAAPPAARPAVAPTAPSPEAAASAPATQAARPGGVDPELEARRKAAEQEQAARQKEEQRREEVRLAQQRADNCARARESLRTLDSGMRMARVNEKGERIVIDEQTRAAEIERARRIVASDCR